MRMDCMQSRLGLTLLTIGGLALNGCSNGTLTTGTTISPAVKTTTTQTLITDAPADQVLALGLTVDSIVLTDSAGSTTTVLSKPVMIEASHLDAVQEPLLPPLNIPQDTYVSATITVASPVVVYADSTTKTVVKVDATLAAASTTVTFTTPITVSATSAPICFDLLVGQSVAISGSTVTVTPTFNVAQISLAKQPTNGGNGRVNGVVGQVVSVSGTSLVVATPNGQQITLTTNTSTVLQGFTALSTLTAGELVDADVAQQQDGSLLALRIHLMTQATNMLLGPVTAVTGSPATSFTQLVRQPLGPSVPDSTTGSSYTVSVTSSTTFGLAPQAGTLPSLPFTALFSASNLIAGQNVMVAASSISGTTAVASSVTLAPQTVDGTIASMTTGSGGLTAYVVTLPSQSALASLTGATTVTVYSNSGTQMMNASQLAVGSTVRFNGLLFNDNGTLRMVAGACNDGPAPAPPQKH